MLLFAGAVVSAAATILLSLGPDYKPWAYRYFREDYTKAAWVYDRLIAAPRPTINLLIGSSHIFNAVDDSQIANSLGSASAAYNAGIPTSARNLQYAVIKDILARNKPRRIFLEVRETEERTSHFGFPILADISEVVSAPMNPWWLRDFVSMLQHRFEYVVTRIPPFRGSKAGLPVPEFGFLPNPHQTVAPITQDIRRLRIPLQYDLCA